MATRRIDSDGDSLAAYQLRSWREAKGLNQVSAATKIGVDQGRYSQFERGVRKPGRRYSVLIEEATGILAADWDAPAPAQRIRKAS